MVILVTGSNGQLGNELRNIVSESPDRYIFTDVVAPEGVETVYLDITDADAVRIVCKSEQVDLIVNCAAYTNVEKAEGDTYSADLLNRSAVVDLAAVCKEEGIILVHISTDYVFSGKHWLPYREDSTVDPLGVYGATKAAGERAILASGCQHLIIRSAWLYSPYGRNFCKTVLEQLRTRETMKVVSDQIGTPTYAFDLARFIVEIISRRDFAHQGIYHYTDSGVASWYDFATAIKALACPESSCKILPCTTSDYPTRARRPAYSVLDKAKIARDFDIIPPHWAASLRDCLSRIAADVQNI